MSQIAGYLEKFKSSDNDFRYMAANDLIEQLNKPEFILEDLIGQKVVNGVLELIQDSISHSEVKNIAVKCLGPLSCKVKYSTLDSMFDTLVGLLKNSKPETCELAAIGIKTIVNVVPATCADSKKSIKKLYSTLLDHLDNASHEIKFDLLEIIIEIINRFGVFIFSNESGNSDIDIMSKSHSSFFEILKHPRPSLKKRSSLALGALSEYLTFEEFDLLNKNLMTELNTTSSDSSNSSMEHARIIIHCFKTISHADTTRFGKSLGLIVPQILEHFKREDEELRECCLLALESFANLCPAEMKEFVPQITQLCLEFISYDPNYADDMEDSDDENSEFEEPEEAELDDEFDDEFSNDDDDAWKVRRSSAKTLRSLISIYPENLQSFYDSASSRLISRFNEREETVRVEVIQAFVSLLSQTINQDTHLIKEISSFDIDYESVGDIASGSIKRRKVESPQTHSPTLPKLTQQGIFDQLPKIVNKISKQLCSKSLPTQQACLILLTELTRTLPGALGSYITKINPGIKQVFDPKFSGKSAILTMGLSSLKLEALSFIRELFRTHHSTTFHDQLDWICPAVLESLGKSSSNSSKESFAVCVEMIKSIRPIYGDDSISGEDSNDKKIFLKNIYRVLFEIINANDADQSTRERCARTLATLMFHSGDLLPNEAENTIRILCDQASSEVNGQTAIQSLTIIMKSPKINWDDIEFSGEVFKYLATLFDTIVPNLRKTSRVLRITTLECLVYIQKCLKFELDTPSLIAFNDETNVVYHSNDIQEISFVLSILESSLSPTLSSKSRSDNLDIVFPLTQDTSLCKLALSPHLQGSASEKLSSLFGAITKTTFETSKDIEATVDFIIQTLTAPVVSGNLEQFSSKLVFSNVSRVVSCVITSFISVKPQDYSKFISQFSSAVSNPNSSVNERCLSFQILGFLSTTSRISDHIDLFQYALNTFEDSNAELRLVAAVAMGQFASSDIPNFFPKLISLIRGCEQHRYLSLHAFKEVVVRYASLDLQSGTIENFADEFWNILINDQAVLQSDESTRNVVAECLGILTLAHPEKFVPLLYGQLKSPSIFVRCVIVTAIRSTFRSDDAKSDNQKQLSKQLSSNMVEFLALLKDENINVRRLTLMTLNAAAHQKPELIRKALPSILHLLLEETNIKEELVHIVSMGPYSYTVDDGLENRKAAYECIYTLIDTCTTHLNLDSIITKQVLSGLNDVQEIKLLSHMIVMRLARLSPTYIRRNIDLLIIPMSADLKIKLKESALRHEVEQHADLIRSTLRTLASLSALASGHSFSKLDEVVTETRQGIHSKEFLKAIDSLKASKI